MRSKSSWLLLAALCGGCSAGDGPADPCVVPAANHPVGELQATVDGEAWVGEDVNGYQLGATGLLVSAASDTIQMSLHLVRSSIITEVEGEDGEVEQQVEDGDAVADVVAAGEVPVDFVLGTAADDGGDLTLHIDSRAHHTGEPDSGGGLRITAIDGDLLGGCFWFDAAATDGSGVAVVEAGTFSIQPH